MNSDVGTASDGSRAAEARRHRFLTEPRGLRGLLSASQLVTGELDLEKLLRRIAESAVTLVDARYGALGVIDSEGRLERFIHVGMPQDVVDRIGDLPRGRGILGAVIESSGPMRLNDLSADSRSVGFPEHHPPMRTFLGVPIKVGGQAYGHLYLTDRANGPFTDDDEDLATALAATAATAITNARLYDQARRAQRISAALSNTTAGLLESVQSDAFTVLVENAAALTGADRAYLVTPIPDDTRLRIAAVRGEGEERLHGMTIPRTDSVVTRAIDGERGISAPGTDPPPPLGAKDQRGSTLAVPLTVSGRTVGALGLTRGEESSRFVSGDLTMVSEFAVEAGIAVALAQARAGQQRLELMEDRARTARDLHDHVIQRLFSTGLGLQALASTIPSHAEILEEHIGAIDAAIADIRTAIFTLQTRGPSQGARQRILDVVTEHGSQFPTAPRVALSGPIDLIVTGQLIEDVIAAIRESLVNVSRHAEADDVEVAVAATSADVTVTVSDDGVGLSAPPGRPSGTANLSERAAAYGGTFSLQTGPSGGTCARWYAPVSTGMSE
ncbi:GAF domain-containing protein [Nesterenkonia sphaerica]|uniref:sensor histidine kinase n=1 Tax=Nesterenkonia sphaerica TaxID=1804988 RepID=UPI00140D9DAD|nr:GAF domain-containing protein [Nesterenkonia sphaerica]